MKILKDAYSLFGLFSNVQNMFKQILITGSLLVCSHSFGATDPNLKYDAYFFDVLTFVQNHPVVLDGLKRIEIPNKALHKQYELSVIYEYQNNAGEVTNCMALFKRSAWSQLIFVDEKVVFAKSDCPID